ncbi:MAG: CCA tRNA nucleotidyltransferase [Candidatus ainarchaeum sp.]|nr:CCA tRNA nucleotidyltransferase [Candidatus ainarchaeum sp.]
MNKEQRQKIYDKVLKKIVPTKKELQDEKKLFIEINDKIKKMSGKHSYLEWCGSSARNTNLRNDQDLDLFLMFNKELTEKELEKEGLRIGKNIFKGHDWEKAYSQHPYIRGTIKGFDVEIVPGYIVKSGAEKKSAVDRTPFHNKYLLKNLKENQKNEVRLLKQFLKGIGAYGADLKNCSLPGYGVELIILKYSNFEKALKKISDWKIGEIIKFENEKITKFEHPLIIIDPVDPKRNVASALSNEQFERIKFASKKFLENPSINFFFPTKIKPWNKKHVKAMLEKKELIGVKFDFPKNILEDLVWGQLRRFLKKNSNTLKQTGFEILREKMWSNSKEVWFIFELNTLNLQKSKKIIGPKVNDNENVEKFLQNKKILSGPRIEENRIIIEIERKETNVIKILKNYLKTEKKKETIAIKRALKNYKILTEKDLLKEYKGEFKTFFTNYLEGKERFER